MTFRKASSYPSLYKPLKRRRKCAPLWFRLLKLLLSIWKKTGGVIWPPCPSYKTLARCLKVSEGTISRAFRKLEESEKCPFKFRSGYVGKGNTRQKLFSLKDGLLFDREPLFRRKDGRSRGIRESFRLDAEPVEPVKTEPPGELKQEIPPLFVPRDERQTAKKIPDRTQGGYCRFRFKEERRLSSAVNGKPAEAGLTGGAEERLPVLPHLTDRMMEREAWLTAEAALADTEIFYDQCRVRMPRSSLKTLILPAIQRGMEWRSGIRRALLLAVHEAHGGAVLGTVQNPGGFAVALFRTRLGLSGCTGKKLMWQRTQAIQSEVRETTPAACWKAPRVPAPPLDKAAVRAQFAEMAAALKRGFA